MKCIIDDGETVDQKNYLNILSEEILPNLSEDENHVFIFKVPEDPEVIRVSADDFKNNLLYECSKLE
ncbi:hypothetical protein ACQKII_12615 [Lysinibacillus sp. NPDC048646]|uniref:hypothetical protein n=1 Tax=Lysinibacillus sp. NPDC048646 TaxID=3390574 RepID=UPI003D040007